jgi:hypothetical protein
MKLSLDSESVVVNTAIADGDTAEEIDKLRQDGDGHIVSGAASASGGRLWLARPVTQYQYLDAAKGSSSSSRKPHRVSATCPT